MNDAEGVPVYFVRFAIVMSEARGAGEPQTSNRSHSRLARSTPHGLRVPLDVIRKERRP